MLIPAWLTNQDNALLIIVLLLLLWLWLLVWTALSWSRPPLKPALRRTAQNFALFLPFPITVSLFFVSLWVSSRGILVVFWSVGTSNVLVFA